MSDGPAAFNVRSIPTAVGMDGQVQDVLVGVQDLLTLNRVAERVVSDARGEGLLNKIIG